MNGLAKIPAITSRRPGAIVMALVTLGLTMPSTSNSQVIANDKPDVRNLAEPTCVFSSTVMSFLPWIAGSRYSSWLSLIDKQHRIGTHYYRISGIDVQVRRGTERSIVQRVSLPKSAIPQDFQKLEELAGLLGTRPENVPDGTTTLTCEAYSLQMTVEHRNVVGLVLSIADVD